jgi:hypothetical protein
MLLDAPVSPPPRPRLAPALRPPRARPAPALPPQTRVNVPDERFDWLVEKHQPKSIVHPWLEVCNK